MNRRAFLAMGGIIAAESGILGTTALVLSDHNIVQAPQRPGKIALDFHAHLAERDAWKNLDELLKVLSRGITALTIGERKRGNLLSYEQALTIPKLKDHIREIDKGLFASVEYNGQTGYIIRNQEIESKYHVLAAPTGDHLKFDYDRISQIDYVMEIVKGSGCYCAIAHVSLKEEPDKPFYKRWRFLNPEEREEVIKIAKQTDGVEVSSSFWINMPIIGNLREGIILAKEMAREQGFVQLTNSDAHERLEQLQTSVMYLDDQSRGQCFEKVINALKAGKFEIYEQPLSKVSVVSSLMKEMIFD
jgi:hypothetical protein